MKVRAMWVERDKVMLAAMVTWNKGALQKLD